ncbi:MAG: hypothetical protein Q9221_000703 [Calogaya cf. arnoldii]
MDALQSPYPLLELHLSGVPSSAVIFLSPRDLSRLHSPLDFLFSALPLYGNSHPSWTQRTVLLQAKEDASTYDCAALSRICNALRQGMSSQCLNFLVEDAGDEPTLWQLRPLPKRAIILESVPAVSLQTLLCNSRHLPLIAKRKLAVILARSLLQLHEGLWLGKEWSKQQVTFLYATSNDLDYQRPYVTTRFDATDQAVPDFSLFHRNASILALGILLIEIHTGKPTEMYRSPKTCLTARR